MDKASGLTSLRTILTRTGDGSPTLYVPELKEHYHSSYGALQESNFVFIQKGLNRKIEKTNIRLFEVGYGTGLNALLSCIEAGKNKKFICYHSIEKFPVEGPIWLEFGKYFYKNALMSKLFYHINECEWDKEIPITKYFTLKKIKSDITTYHNTGLYDVIFFDAFSPEVQPEMWSADIFLKMAGMMEKGGILSTYSAKGQVRRNMISAGLEVERTAGPPGKREILVATRKG